MLVTYLYICFQILDTGVEEQVDDISEVQAEDEQNETMEGPASVEEVTAPSTSTANTELTETIRDAEDKSSEGLRTDEVKVVTESPGCTAPTEVDLTQGGEDQEEEDEGEKSKDKSTEVDADSCEMTGNDREEELRNAVMFISSPGPEDSSLTPLRPTAYDRSCMQEDSKVEEPCKDDAESRETEEKEKEVSSPPGIVILEEREHNLRNSMSTQTRSNSVSGIMDDSDGSNCGVPETTHSSLSMSSAQEICNKQHGQSNSMSSNEDKQSASQHPSCEVVEVPSGNTTPRLDNSVETIQPATPINPGSVKHTPPTPSQTEIPSMGVYTPDSTTNSVHSLHGYGQCDLDVSQLGLESPTSISSNDMASQNSVEPPRPPSVLPPQTSSTHTSQTQCQQTYSDCAQQGIQSLHQHHHNQSIPSSTAQQHVHMSISHQQTSHSVQQPQPQPQQQQQQKKQQQHHQQQQRLGGSGAGFPPLPNAGRTDWVQRP